jgi:peroxiredoxin
MAPDFTLTDIDENVFSLSDFRGKVVLLDFFATWCGPCRAEMPHLKALNEKFGEELVIISISVDPNYDSVERLKSFRQDYNITWTLARDTTNVQAQYNVTAIPTLYIIDQNGYVRFHHVGLTEEDALTTEISQIVPEFPTSLTTIILFIIIGLATLKLKYKLTKIGKQQH